MKTHLDLFSGIGGFAIAAQACGYTTIGFCEKEPYAQQILKERFGAVLADAKSGAGKFQPSERKDLRDITSKHGAQRTAPRMHPDIFTLNGADYAGVDLLTGGFPCQPFSVAGKRRGAADDRALWPEMLRVIDGAKPAWLIGENVAGIVTMELDNILSDLEALGYAAWPLVIPACAVDARHRRDRVWIVAHADSAPAQGNQRAERGEQERAFAGQHCEWGDEGEWFAESGMGRVAHGIPHRAHRLRGLGNAIVPQVAYEIIRAIPPHIPGREIALAMGAGML
jgi:DNA (cytosine-5)-methyltransferase 1